ncbi:MAG: hypothetical protein JNG89_03105 [Planctomycetaceae bacterium]|nr:hypothetical protein [Planctomycetaceae bacterium]
MATMTAPQPISGVSAGRETVIEDVFPSISASGLGRFLGQLMDSIPVSINGIRFSQVLFGPVVAPLALVGYLQFKVTGPVYLLTNRSVQTLTALSRNLIQTVALSDIDNIEIRVLPGQAFYQAGDLLLLNARGDVLMTLAGIPRPARFRQVILDAREARIRSDHSLGVIRSRG